MARNFSFSKATKDYIYVPDADELLDEENRKRFSHLKQTLLPEVEIVQMLYHTISEYNTVLNARATAFFRKKFGACMQKNY